VTSPTYTAPFTLSSSATVTYRSWDTAGNAEGPKSQAIAIANEAPVAALTATPTSGIAPFAVSANASDSTDPDSTPISSYTFNFGDGTAAVTQASATAAHNYTKTGTFTVTVTARDTAGLTGTATKQVVSKQNLIGNPGFESNTSGWAPSGTGVSLTRVSGGHSGSWSGRISNSGSTARTCILDDSPNQVPKTAAGTYTASLWVRGDVAGATMNLRLQEMNGTTIVSSATSTLILSTAWQQITVSRTILQPGTALNFNAYVTNVPASATAFYADDATLSLG